LGVPVPTRPRRRTPGHTVVETAPDNDKGGDDQPTRWYQHTLLTVAAFLIFPPLGLWIAIRLHGLWRQRIGIRIAAVALTIGLLVVPYAGPASGDARSGITDGAPIVAQIDLESGSRSIPSA
jgi:hypothetical protein